MFAPIAAGFVLVDTGVVLDQDRWRAAGDLALRTRPAQLAR